MEERSGVCREVFLSIFSGVSFANVAEAYLGKTDTREGEPLSMCNCCFVSLSTHTTTAVSTFRPPLVAVTECERRGQQPRDVGCVWTRGVWSTGVNRRGTGKREPRRVRFWCLWWN